MSDYYGTPISIPPGVTAPNVNNLYQLAQQVPYGQPSALPFGAGAGVGARSLPYIDVGGAEAAAAGTSGAGGLSGLLGRVSMPDLSLAEGLTLRSGARAFGGPAIAGQLATAGINYALPSTGSMGNVRQVLGDAATGAGLGAGVGSIVPGIGTAVGGVTGGALGAAYGLADSLFGSDDSKPDYRATLASTASQLGLNPNNYTAAFDLLSKSGADPKTLSVQLAQQLMGDAQQQQAQSQATQQAASQREMDQRFALAMQAQAQQFFTPYVNNIITAGASQADLLKGLAQSLPAPYRSVMENQAAQALTQSQNLAGAYAAQSALIPGQFMAQAELKRQAQLQQLQYQQQVIAAQQARSGAGGGVAGLNQILQGQQVPGQQAQTPALATTGR